MLYVRDVRANPAKYNLPKEFITNLPGICGYCGGLMQLSEDLRVYTCSNPDCIEHKSRVLYKLLKYIGLTDISLEEASKIILHTEWKNPFEIFTYNSNKKAYYRNILKKRQSEILNVVENVTQDILPLNIIVKLFVDISSEGYVRIEKENTVDDMLQRLYMSLEQPVNMVYLQDIYNITKQRERILEAVKIVSVLE